ncbi:MAG: hypothetical protein U0165_10805 [Polyangiaceae bacterium]
MATFTLEGRLSALEQALRMTSNEDALRAFDRALSNASSEELRAIVARIAELPIATSAVIEDAWIAIRHRVSGFSQERWGEWRMLVESIEPDVLFTSIVLPELALLKQRHVLSLDVIGLGSLRRADRSREQHIEALRHALDHIADSPYANWSPARLILEQLVQHIVVDADVIFGADSLMSGLSPDEIERDWQKIRKRIPALPKALPEALRALVPALSSPAIEVEGVHARSSLQRAAIPRSFVTGPLPSRVNNVDDSQAIPSEFLVRELNSLGLGGVAVIPVAEPADEEIARRNLRDVSGKIRSLWEGLVENESVSLWNAFVSSFDANVGQAPRVLRLATLNFLALEALGELDPTQGFPPELAGYIAEGALLQRALLGAISDHSTRVSSSADESVPPRSSHLSRVPSSPDSWWLEEEPSIRSKVPSDIPPIDTGSPIVDQHIEALSALSTKLVEDLGARLLDLMKKGVGGLATLFRCPDALAEYLVGTNTVLIHGAMVSLAAASLTASIDVRCSAQSMSDSVSRVAECHALAHAFVLQAHTSSTTPQGGAIHDVDAHRGELPAAQPQEAPPRIDWAHAQRSFHEVWAQVLAWRVIQRQAAFARDGSPEMLAPLVMRRLADAQSYLYQGFDAFPEERERNLGRLLTLMKSPRFLANVQPIEEELHAAILSAKSLPVTAFDELMRLPASATAEDAYDHLARALAILRMKLTMPGRSTRRFVGLIRQVMQWAPLSCGGSFALHKEAGFEIPRARALFGETYRQDHPLMALAARTNVRRSNPSPTEVGALLSPASQGVPGSATTASAQSPGAAMSSEPHDRGSSPKR